MKKLVSAHPFYFYISSAAGCDPVKTIYLCCPQQDAASLEGAEHFAKRTGWKEIAERAGAVLVVPVAPEGWEAEAPDFLLKLYNETRNSFKSRSGSAIWGRGGSLWCWETILYIVGYKEGAVYAGNFLTSHPNFAAAVSLIDGLPEHFEAGEEESNHWMVKNPKDYFVRNRDIPVCLWAFSSENTDKITAHYASMYDCFAEEVVGNICTQVYKDSKNQANQVRIIRADFRDEAERSRFIYTQQFAHVIRWKNGPDGTLAWVDSKQDFYSSTRFLRHSISIAGVSYDYFVHLPKGKETEKNLPVVFNIHGRGEPAWMYADKNGWNELGDRTGEFIVVTPDSPGNGWFSLRDGILFPLMIEELVKRYQVDQTRIYLAGFSNGAVMVRELAYQHPELYAAVASSNGPAGDTYSMHQIDESKLPDSFAPEIQTRMDIFAADGWEMPIAFFYGDNDPTVQKEKDLSVPFFLNVNHCDADHGLTCNESNYFTSENGYQEGNRFSTVAYSNDENDVRVLVTLMKNMPHGAINEETQLIWEFFRNFCRKKHAKQVERTGS